MHHSSDQASSQQAASDNPKGGSAHEDEGEPSPGASGPPQDERSSSAGILAAFTAYLLWGILPIFWKALSSVDPFEVLCHRIAWSFVMLVPFMFFSGRFGELARFFKRPRNLIGLICSGFLLAGNWYLYIWAISSGMVLETSLGYYINPLVSILFGVIFFKEHLSKIFVLSIVIATLGVIYQVIMLGHLPVVPLGLAFSFATYALLRKILLVQALPGLFVETLVVLPFALGYLFWQAHLGNSAFFLGDFQIDALLIGAGLITTIPLILFAYGARRIRMSSLGLLQYVNPSCVFLLGVFVYNEPFSFDNLVTFICIWTALALYTWETLRSKQW